MALQKKKFSNQKGNFLLSTAIAILAGGVLAIGSAKNAINTANQSTGMIAGNQLQTVVNGLNSYIAANTTGLNAGSVTGVASAMAPTVAELKTLGYIPNWVIATPTYGTAFVNQVSKTNASCPSNCSFYGVTYLQDPLVTKDKNASVDIRTLQSAAGASSTSQIGYSMPGSGATISGPGWTLANPDVAARAGILLATTNVVASTTSGHACTAYDEAKGIDCTSQTQLKANTTGTNLTAIGINAGAANTIGSSNVFSGGNAGRSNTTGGQNVFTGAYAGQSNTTGVSNVFTGAYAGLNNTIAWGNVFTGTYAGQVNTTGGQNVFTGYAAGQSNTTGGSNVFTGYQAGQSNTTGWGNVFTGFLAGRNNTTGVDNVFVGYQSGYSNLSANNNIYIGYQAGYAAQGSGNIFTGFQAGQNSTGGNNNVFTGVQAGQNTTGGGNIFTGYLTGQYNTTGFNNVFTGAYAGYLNTTGNNNVFEGYQSGYSNTTSYTGVFLGYQAGYNNTSGNNNVFIGRSAGASNTTSSNVIAIGANATNTVSNTARIGDTTMTQIGGQVAWTNLSDRRAKKDIRDSLRGLDFIKKLRSVDYTLIGNNKAETGFIAQEVEEVDPTFPGVNKPANDEEFYSLAYTDFIPSIVNAIKELDSKIDARSSAPSEDPKIIYLLSGAFALLVLWNLHLQVSISRLNKRVAESDTKKAA